MSYGVVFFYWYKQTINSLTRYKLDVHFSWLFCDNSFILIAVADERPVLWDRGTIAKVGERVYIRCISPPFVNVDEILSDPVSFYKGDEYIAEFGKVLPKYRRKYEGQLSDIKFLDNTTRKFEFKYTILSR